MTIIKFNKGKGPKDGRKRPVYIIRNNKRELAISNGRGDCFEPIGDSYEQYSSPCMPDRKINPAEYEFERGLTGFDF